MEADWEFEIGGDAPIIDACWLGFVDLRWHPQQHSGTAKLLKRIPEAVAFPPLAGVLERLNQQRSPVWTSKCDFWPSLASGEFDADEMDATEVEAAHAMGCYIDLLPRSDQQWNFPKKLVSDCKHLCDRLRAMPLRCCRVDLMVRRARITPDLMDTGITAYLTGCGKTVTDARQALAAALEAFADVLCPDSTVQ
jgi:hypothetical protein